MLSQLLQGILDKLHGRGLLLPWPLVLKLLLLPTLLLAWRIWRFTIQPILKPDEPRELPYWIPFYGHAGSFFKNSRQLMSKALACLGSNAPFSLTIAGKTFYVITNPVDTKQYFADIVSLSWDQFLDRVLVGFGCDPGRLDTMWKDNAPSTINPKGKNLIHLTEDLFKQHLLPGPNLERLTSRYQEVLGELMSWESLSAKYGMALMSRTRDISLFDLCSEFMIDASQMALFDPVLFAIDPNMTANLRDFTDQLWKLLYPTRFVDSTEVRELLKQYTRAFEVYQRLPKEMRKNEAWVITTLIDQYRELGIHEVDSAAMLVMIYWTGDANAYKAAFWMLSYIVFDPDLLAMVRSETAPAVGANGEVDIKFLETHCPRLTSIYHEVLRLTKCDNVFRHVVRDVVVSGKLLHANSTAIIPTDQIHTNIEVYGPDAEQFNPERFLKQPDLTNDPSYRPYGGGRNYCPGRYFAMQEIFAFIAVVVNRYNVELSWPGQKFPLRDECSLTLGIYRPIPGSDLFVTLKDPSG